MKTRAPKTESSLFRCTATNTQHSTLGSKVCFIATCHITGSTASDRPLLTVVSRRFLDRLAVHAQSAGALISERPEAAAPYLNFALGLLLGVRRRSNFGCRGCPRTPNLCQYCPIPALYLYANFKVFLAVWLRFILFCFILLHLVI